MNLSEAQQRMLTATVMCVLPVALFLYIAFSQNAGTVAYLRVVPIVALVALGWVRPRIAGWALIAIGVVFVGIYAASVRQIQLLPTIALALIFLLPILSAGYLFLKAHRYATTAKA